MRAGAVIDIHRHLGSIADRHPQVSRPPIPGAPSADPNDMKPKLVLDVRRQGAEIVDEMDKSGVDYSVIFLADYALRWFGHPIHRRLENALKSWIHPASCSTWTRWSAISIRWPRHFAINGVRLRPHSKTHKAPNLALMQLERGAIGVCCAKVGEAEVMAAGGVSNLLVTTEVTGQAKIRR